MLEMAQLPNSGSPGSGNKATPLFLVWKRTACRHGPANLSARRLVLEVLLLCSMHAARMGPGVAVVVLQGQVGACREARGNAEQDGAVHHRKTLPTWGKLTEGCHPSLVSFASSHWQWFCPCLKVSSKPCGSDARWFC